MATSEHLAAILEYAEGRGMTDGEYLRVANALRDAFRGVEREQSRIQPRPYITFALEEPIHIRIKNTPFNNVESIDYDFHSVAGNNVGIPLNTTIKSTATITTRYKNGGESVREATLYELDHMRFIHYDASHYEITMYSATTEMTYDEWKKTHIKKSDTRDRFHYDLIYKVKMALQHTFWSMIREGTRDN
jgi:hypothetical protein